jgi:hypothetical protein
MSRNGDIVSAYYRNARSAKIIRKKLLIETILSAGQSPAFSFACKSYRNSGNRANHQEESEFVKKETERPVRVTPEKDDPRRKKQETQQHGCPAKCP